MTAPHRHLNSITGTSEQASLATASLEGIASLGSVSEAETIANQPPAARRANNYLSNPTFNADSFYPGASQTPHSRSKNAFNGKGVAATPAAPNNKTPANWARYCPIFTSSDTNDFYTILNNYYLRSRKKEDEYLDIAAENSTGAVSDGGYKINPPQHRILGLFGTSNHLNSRNNDPDRNYPAIPVYGMTSGNIDSDSTLADGDGWVKNCYYQIITNIPANAVKVKYGAHVQITAADDLNGKNYAAIQVSQCYYDGNPFAAGHTRVVYGHSQQIKKLGQNIPSPSISSTTAAFTNFNWSGPSKDEPTNAANPGISWPYIRWPSSITTSGGTTTSNLYRDFKLVEGTWTGLQARTGTFASQLGSLLFELCFYENGANITDATGNTTGSGSARFYAPFVQFLDSSDNVIST